VVALALVSYFGWDYLSGRLLRPRPTTTPIPTTPPRPTTIVGPTGVTEIESVWLEHNVQYEDVYYLAIHTTFRVSRSDVSHVWAAARFYESDGTPMIALTDDYSLDGQVGVQESAILGDAPESYLNDLTLYIPNEVFSEGVGHFASIEVRDADTDEILAWADTESFDVNP
jgi:hypothetical protein